MAEQRRRTKGGTKTTAVLNNDRVHPPDKKKFEHDTAEINRQIKDLEAKLRAAQADNSHQTIVGELTKLQAELSETEKRRANNKSEVRKMEDQLKRLGEDVMKKKNEASSLLAGMRFSSESKIDETISKLNSVMLSRQQSDSDKRKYKHEIETLEKSKLQLREFTQAKEAADKMRTEQDELRKRRDSCYRLSRDLKDKEVKLKDKMDEVRTALEHAKEKRREVSTQKDNITKDIASLYERRRQLIASFRSQQSAYQEERMRIRQEEERKREEDRQAQKEAKFKRKLDQEVWRAVLYDEDIAIAKALIAHLQATTGSSMSYSSDYAGNDGDSPSSSSTNLDPPERGAATATGGGVASPRDNSVSHKPGEFLRKKDKEDEVLVPTRWTVVRRKSKREKKRSTVPKRLNFNPATFQQFNYLGIQPPSSHAEIPDVIAKLQEKLTFYERKNKATLGVPAYSEAGDSGVGGMTDVSQVQSVATSQEDLHLITVSPNTSVTDLKYSHHPQASPASPSFSLQHHPPTDNDDLSDNESSQTVVEDDESSTPRSNSSMMAAVSSS